MWYFCSLYTMAPCTLKIKVKCLNWTACSQLPQHSHTVCDFTHSGPSTWNTFHYQRKLGFNLMSSHRRSSPIGKERPKIWWQCKVCQPGPILRCTDIVGPWLCDPIPSQVPQHGSCKTLQVNQHTLPLLCGTDNLSCGTLPSCHFLVDTVPKICLADWPQNC
jgi:hypothetical protein